MFRHIRLAPYALLLLPFIISACRGPRTLTGQQQVARAQPCPPVYEEVIVEEAPADVIIEESPIIVEEMPPVEEGMPPAEEGMPPMEETPPIEEAMPPVEEAVPAPEDEVDTLMDEVRSRAAVEADRTRFIVRQKIQAARVHIDNSEYRQAEQRLQEALQLQPGNRDAQNELRMVQDLLGHRASGAQNYAEEQAEIARVRIDEQKVKASKLSSVGQMHMVNGRFDDAIENFEQALFIINTSPYEIDWGNLKSDTEDGLRQANYMKEQEAAKLRRDAITTSLDEMAQKEYQSLVAEMQRLERWMAEGVSAFERNDYALAADYAGRVLEIQPDNTKARDLQLAAARASHGQARSQYLRDEKLRFREWLDDINATRIPQDKILVWPSQSFWERITAARARARPSFGDAEVDAEAVALEKKIAGTSINLAVDNQPFSQVVTTLQVQTGFNIMVDARVADEIGENPVIGLQLSDVPMRTALDLLRTQGGEDVVWITQGNVVIFTKKEYVKMSLVVQIHSVADLTTGLTDFIPPKIQLVSPDDVSDEENPLFGAEGEDPKYPYGQVDELIDLIKNAVARPFWEDGGGDITAQGEHALVVRATSEIQEQVDQFLTDLRGFAGIVVTVETRFLEVGDAFLRDVGVDFRGLGGTTPGGTIVNLDDVTNGLEDMASSGFDNGGGGLVTGAALNPSAGAYFNDGGDGDFRARTENIFDRPLGNVLSALGGTTLTLGYIDDTQFSMIVRATEKSAMARVLTAPTVTVHNTQRANLTVVNQLSYIQDFDVEVAQTSFIADPIVGIIQDGLTLDVRPTVSQDRRYITLELQPTVADLVEPIPTFATTLASSFAPVIIQLPELRLQQARTTVRIPDKGSILIGGLKNITTVDRQSVTPFIDNIPVLSFFFSRKGRSDEVSHLMILVRAQITDLTEQQDRLMRR